MQRFVIRHGQNFVSDICRNGMLVVTSKVGGSPTHDGKGTINQAMLFASAKSAQEAVAAYLAKNLPKGKSHSKLEVQPI